MPGQLNPATRAAALGVEGAVAVLRGPLLRGDAPNALRTRLEDNLTDSG